jgi:indole-3-glycerol phosphate synthase
MNTLSNILEHKKHEIAQRKKERSIRDLEQEAAYHLPRLSLANSVQRSTPGIIAEIKRKSPSRGAINLGLEPVQLAKAYQDARAAGISVLTDFNFFGGTPQDLTRVKSAVTIPVLRKDFILDEYQLFEAKAMGADAVLLIAEALEKSHLHELALIATSLGMEVLMEIHTADQLDKFNEEVALLGVNNRNLKTQTTSLQTSLDLRPFLPKDVVLISESGIQKAEELLPLMAAGYHGALIGTSIVGSEHPSELLREFSQLKMEQL